jgi:hypothetical protein
MIVIEAWFDPWTQSLSVTGGNREASVGPAVGFGLTTVHPTGEVVPGVTIFVADGITGAGEKAGVK